MQKKSLAAFLCLSAATLTLAACGGEEQPSDTSSSLPPIAIEDSALGYLKGRFFGKDGTLTLSKEGLSLTGKKELALTPTSVGTVETKQTVGGENVTTNVPAVYFAPDYNGGADYRIYADTEGDGFVHLEKKEGGEYAEEGIFQVDASMYAGPLSYDGSGDIWNAYYVFDGAFDFERDVYPLAITAPGSGSWTYEQAWSAISHLRVDNENAPFVTLEFFDSDDYGYGETKAVLQDGKVNFFEDADTLTWVSDEGAFRSLSLFDGEKKVALDLDPGEKTITMDEKDGTYATGADEKGFYLEASFSGEKMKLRMGDHYVTKEEGTKETVLPLDLEDALLGTYTDKKDAFEFALGEEGYELKWNGAAVAYEFAISDKRKAVSFKDGSDSILVSPDKDGSSVRVEKNGEVAYFINDEKYSSLFADTFVAKGEEEFAILIDGDFSYSFKGQTGKASYSYWHGDKFPSLLLEDGTNIEIAQEDAGYFLLKEGTKETVLYSGSALNAVYGEYSSDGKDSFLIDATAISYKGKRYAYTFKPYYYANMGVYIFALDSELGYFRSNLASCLYSDDLSFVKKDVFSSIAGTYSGYGAYGLENIKFTSDGEFFLDVVNDTGDGLLKDQAREYLIATQNGGAKAVVSFEHRGYIVNAFFFDGYVTIMGLNYYEQQTVLSYGVYLDETNSHILFLQGEKVYYDGTLLTVNSRVKTGNSLLLETSGGTLLITFDEDGEVLNASFDGVSYSRTLSFLDYEKFVGSYTSGEDVVTVARTSLSYEITIKGAFSPVALDSAIMVLRNGHIALKVSYGLTDYYLVLGEDGTVTLEVSSGSLPPPPPLI